MKHLTPTELATWLADDSRPKPFLLDVREPWEFETCQIAGAENRPMDTIRANVGQLDSTLPTVVICHHGMRSYQVGSFLERAGFDEVYNLNGGVAAWASEIDPEMARY
ncbi:rhodanese-like domain-containing protein [Chitinimonas sp. BJB300]|uniref:rhodanese-like domain-containing protein n=1 Tax=Chitinimonas sp. BJB300 TaxID=1559339 RepID=UPI000C0D9084|nr:rhodanese-like domain-containing protein [Chitinimonas sp. BJB300]PHV10574.1 sulfurtransferase [Chitinimonas sp. BJB300]TSJ91048.1 sulfurtransferase [Chitinimonas sp. BJB300]